MTDEEYWECIENAEIPDIDTWLAMSRDEKKEFLDNATWAQIDSISGTEGALFWQSQKGYPPEVVNGNLYFFGDIPEDGEDDFSDYDPKSPPKVHDMDEIQKIINGESVEE